MKLLALILSAVLAGPLAQGRARRQDIEATDGTTDGDYVEYAEFVCKRYYGYSGIFSFSQ